MKRLILAAIIMMSSLANVSCASAMEGNPQTDNELAILAVFNETNYRNPSVNATLISNEQTTYKKMEINQRETRLIKEVKALFEKDLRRKGASVVEKWDGGDHKYIVSFLDGKAVCISLEEENDGSVSVWISY